MTVNPEKCLAWTENYQVHNEFETTCLHRPGVGEVVIGSFYGDPHCAIIDKNEKWCVVAGDGLLVYWLREPFAECGRKNRGTQWDEFGRKSDDVWWIDEMEQIGPTSIRLRIRPADAHAGLYELDVSNMSVTRATDADEGHVLAEDELVRPAEIVRRYTSGGRHFTGIDIEDPDDADQWAFRGATLDGADFSGSFIVADFTGASLKGASFSGANVKTCIFDKADLSGADFRGAALCSATFGGADVTGADFTGATIHSHVFEAGELPDH